MLSPIGDYLKKSINKAGVGRQIEAAQVCQFWEEAIKSIFDRDIVNKSQAVRFKNGTLTVAVLSSVLAQEFKFKEEEITGEINKRIGRNAVRRIRFEM